MAKVFLPDRGRAAVGADVHGLGDVAEVFIPAPRFDDERAARRHGGDAFREDIPRPVKAPIFDQNRRDENEGKIHPDMRAAHIGNRRREVRTRPDVLTHGAEGIDPRLLRRACRAQNLAHFQRREHQTMMPLPTAMRIASYTSSIHSTGTKPVPAGPLVCVSRSMMSPARRIAQAEEWFGAEPATDETPEKTFARRWALAVLETAHAALRQRAEEAGKAEHFALLAPSSRESRSPANTKNSPRKSARAPTPSASPSTACASNTAKPPRRTRSRPPPRHASRGRAAPFGRGAALLIESLAFEVWRLAFSPPQALRNSDGGFAFATPLRGAKRQTLNAKLQTRRFPPLSPLD